MDKKHQKIVLTGILVVYALAMIIGAILPNPGDVPVFSGNTTYFHLFGFIVLSVMIFRTLQLYDMKHRYILGIILLATFILLTEVLQLFVSTRSFSIADMIVDALGCTIGWGLYQWIYSKR